MKSSTLGYFAACASIVLFAACVLAAPQASGYHLLKKVTFGAAPGTDEYFDYVNFDPIMRRAYLSHGTEFIVFDADKGTTVGTIPGFKRDHGVALVPELNRGFITDGTAAQIVMFDLKTLKVLSQIKGEEDADGIIYDPASKHVFAFNGNSKSATVIDPSKGAVISTLPLGGAPEQAVADGKGMIYNNLEDTNEVIAIDSHDLVIKSRWPVAPAGGPVSIAMDQAHRRLFIGGRNPKMLVVMNADTGKIIGPPFPIGDRVDTNVFDPGTGMIAAATKDGRLFIFHEDSPDKISLVEAVKTEYGAKTMGLDPKTHNIYLTTSDFGPTPVPTAKQPDPQPVATPGTFRLLIYGR
jgi:DNA-binding beta-propeller fold protein YncE